MSMKSLSIVFFLAAFSAASEISICENGAEPIHGEDRDPDRKIAKHKAEIDISKNASNYKGIVTTQSTYINTEGYTMKEGHDREDYAGENDSYLREAKTEINILENISEAKEDVDSTSGEFVVKLSMCPEIAAKPYVDSLKKIRDYLERIYGGKPSKSFCNDSLLTYKHNVRHYRRQLERFGQIDKARMDSYNRINDECKNYHSLSASKYSIAILSAKDSTDSQEAINGNDLSLITNNIRRSARDVLPYPEYNIVYDRNADYITHSTIRKQGMLSSKYVLEIEILDKEGGLITQLKPPIETNADSLSIKSLLYKIPIETPAMFKEFFDRSPESIKQAKLDSAAQEWNGKVKILGGCLVVAGAAAVVYAALGKDSEVKDLVKNRNFSKAEKEAETRNKFYMGGIIAFSIGIPILIF